MWYSKVISNLGNIPDFIAYYEGELEEARRDCSIGGLVEKNISNLPGITERRFNQLQEIEAVLNYLNIQLRKIRRKHFQKYLEGYARALINEVALLRNKFLGIIKAYESKNFMLGHIVRLRAAGMEDIQI